MDIPVLGSLLVIAECQSRLPTPRSARRPLTVYRRDCPNTVYWGDCRKHRWLARLPRRPLAGVIAVGPQGDGPSSFCRAAGVWACVGTTFAEAWQDVAGSAVDSDGGLSRAGGAAWPGAASLWTD